MLFLYRVHVNKQLETESDKFFKHIFNSIKINNPEKKLSWTANGTAEATDISKASVCTGEVTSM
jgi:hypothetical protein